MVVVVEVVGVVSVGVESAGWRVHDEKCSVFRWRNSG